MICKILVYSALVLQMTFVVGTFADLSYIVYQSRQHRGVAFSRELFGHQLYGVYTK